MRSHTTRFSAVLLAAALASVAPAYAGAAGGDSEPTNHVIETADHGHDVRIWWPADAPSHRVRHARTIEITRVAYVAEGVDVDGVSERALRVRVTTRHWVRPEVFKQSLRTTFRSDGTGYTLSATNRGDVKLSYWSGTETIPVELAWSQVRSRRPAVLTVTVPASAVQGDWPRRFHTGLSNINTQRAVSDHAPVVRGPLDLRGEG
jgi:hypothetical protein